MPNPFENHPLHPENAAEAATPPVRTPDDVLDEFGKAPLPDAIDGLLFRLSMADPDDPAVTGFERYAARILSEAHAVLLRGIAATHTVELRRLNTTGLFWINFSTASLSADERDCVLGIESALNRLVLIARLAETVTAAPLTAAELDEGRCSELDAVAIRSITRNAGALLTASERDNRLLSLNGVAGARGGNWDVSARFAEACENMPLPFRLDYLFECNVEHGTLAVVITLPRPEQFPLSLWDRSADAWSTRDDLQVAACSAYNLRLAATVAAAAFGSSVGITRVIVNGREASISNPTVLSVGFDRMPFMAATAPALRAGLLSDPATQYDPARLFDLIKPSGWHIEIGADGRALPVEPFDPGTPQSHIPLQDDTRLLPEHLRGLLHADTVAELDITSEQDETMRDRLRHAIDDSADASLLAIAQLEDIVSETDVAFGVNAAGDAQSEDADDDRPLLYCENAVARCLVSLVDANPNKRWRRASDAGQIARTTLARLYREMGDPEGAIAQAQACVKLAPSSPAAYQALITPLASTEQYGKVIDTAKEALRYAVLDEEASYLYYRLAYAYWRVGRFAEAAACYTRVLPVSSMADAAAQELRDLVQDANGKVDLSGMTVGSTLRAAGVPLAPTREALEALTKAAIGLCDADMPLAAAPYIGALGLALHDDTLMSISSALRRGAR